MKMMRRTRITSTRLMMLISESACWRFRVRLIIARLPCSSIARLPRSSTHRLAREGAQQIAGESAQLLLEHPHSPEVVVEGDRRRNRGREPASGDDERLGDP